MVCVSVSVFSSCKRSELYSYISDIILLPNPIIIKCAEPSKPPSLLPMENPSKGPTLSRPTNATIVQGTPTASPEIFPSNSPSITSSSWPSAHPTTAKPTARPTVAPSHGPSLSPTPGSTNGPTTSPTGQKEQLITDLKALSPLSSDSLDNERSDQYRAMEW